MESHRSYCRLCQALCGIIVTTEGEKVLDVTGDPTHPTSEGYTCPKGRSLPALHHRPDRLDHPALGRGPQRRRVSWEAVLDDLAAGVAAAVDAVGPDGVAMYVGTGSAFDGAGRATTRRFMRAIGSRSYYSSGTVDSPCKPLVAELVAGHGTIIPHVGPAARLVLLVGFNPVVAHGHLQAMPNPRTRLRRWRDQGQLWVADPRRTATTAMATRHIVPRPGSDHVWLAGVTREVLRHTDLEELRSRATGVDELIAAVEPFDAATVAAGSGVPPQDIIDLAAAIRDAGRIGIASGTGMTMHRGANVAHWLLWALCIITDSLDHPEGMWFNPGLLHSFDHTTMVPTEGVAGPGPASRPELPERVGELPAAAIVDEIEAGNVRALFVVGANPVSALPQTPRLTAALRSLEVLAVADVLPGATVDLATHVLPVTGQLERPDLPWFDTIAPAIIAQYTPAIVEPAAERRHAWWILGQLGRRLGHDVLAGHDPDTATSDDLLARMTRRSRVPFDQLRDLAGPVVDDDVPYGWVRGVLPPGGWRLAPEPLVGQLRELALPARSELTLGPSRQLRQLNSLLTDGPTADGWREHATVALHPDDAAERDIAAGDTVEIVSAHGRVQATANPTAAMPPGVVTLPHGFAEVNVNALTSSAELDPLTGMPVYAGLPVTIRRLASAAGGS